MVSSCANGRSLYVLMQNAMHKVGNLIYELPSRKFANVIIQKHIPGRFFVHADKFNLWKIAKILVEYRDR